MLGQEFRAHFRAARVVGSMGQREQQAQVRKGTGHIGRGAMGPAWEMRISPRPQRPRARDPGHTQPAGSVAKAWKWPRVL